MSGPDDVKIWLIPGAALGPGRTYGSTAVHGTATDFAVHPRLFAAGCWPPSSPTTDAPCLLGPLFLP